MYGIVQLLAQLSVHILVLISFLCSAYTLTMEDHTKLISSPYIIFIPHAKNLKQLKGQAMRLALAYLYVLYTEVSQLTVI